MMRFFVAVMLSVAITIPSVDIAKAGWREERCRYQTFDGKVGWSNDEVIRTIKCGVDFYKTPGGVDRALCYAKHESGYNEFAKNPYSSATGIYQIIDGTWNSIYNKYVSAREFWPVRYNRYNPRSNILMALRHVKSAGWGDWSNWASYSCP